MTNKNKSIEPDVTAWFTTNMDNNNTKYYNQQGCKNINSDIEQALVNAPSKQNGTGGNRPDFSMLIITKDNKQYPVMIEAKGTIDRLVKKDKNGFVTNKTDKNELDFTAINNYAVNGAVHYANAILNYCEYYDSVIAAGINVNFLNFSD